MTAGLEIYDSEGSLLLSNEHMLLTLGEKKLLGTGPLGKTITTVWDSAGGHQDPQTGNLYNSGGASIEFVSQKSSPSYPYDAWYMPITEGGIAYTQGANSFAVKQGTDINLALMKDDFPTQSDKYLSLYNTSGVLLWSAAAIEKAAVVMEKINLNGQGLITIDLTKYGVPISEIYLKSSYMGGIAYGDTGLDYYSGIVTKRVGNTIYLRAGTRWAWTQVARDYYVYIARIRS